MERIKNPKTNITLMESIEMVEQMEQLREELRILGSKVFKEGKPLTDSELINKANALQNIYSDLNAALKGDSMDQFEKRQLMMKLSGSDNAEDMELNEQCDDDIRSVSDIIADFDRILNKR